MTTHPNFPKDWQLILLAAIMFFLCLQACTTTRKVQLKQTKEETKSTVSTETKTDLQAETNTKTLVTSETVITEDCDTNITVWVKVKDSTMATTFEEIRVPIKVRKTTHSKVFSDQDQQKKESGNTAINRNEQLNKNSSVSIKNKDVERTIFPWWATAIIVAGVLGALALLLRKLKVF